MLLHNLAFCFGSLNNTHAPKHLNQELVFYHIPQALMDYPDWQSSKPLDPHLDQHNQAHPEPNLVPAAEENLDLNSSKEPKSFSIADAS